VNGSRYNGVCPASDEPGLRIGYNEGLATFCTKDSGFAAGSDARECQEICPIEMQQEVLHGYVAGLDAAVPGLDSHISRLTTEVAQAESRLGDLGARVQSLQSLRSAAKREGNEASVEFYDQQLSPLNAQRFSVESDLRSSEGALAASLQRRRAIGGWALKWRASLL